VLSEVGEAYQALSWLGKSNRLRLKFVTKVNGKDVLSGSMLHNINGFVIKKYGEFYSDDV
jgi:hypothetical protein